MSEFDRARGLLREFKGDSYLYGDNVLPKVGEVVNGVGRRAVLVSAPFPGAEGHVQIVKESLARCGVTLAAEIRGAQPNAPREDLFRIAEEIEGCEPDVMLSFGGGSTIDAAKAAEVLRSLGGGIDEYFGTGLVTAKLEVRGTALTPHVAIQTAASSASHLTKYSNITDLGTGQKKLIVDPAIVPRHPIFDHQVTRGAPRDLTADGALDGIAHIVEVLYGAAGKAYYGRMGEIARTGIRLVLDHLPRALEDPEDRRAREALCLATDLGGYAIMLGGTNGGHLTSFSLVDILTHGRACALMNPYYTVFFAPAIVEALELIGLVYREAGYIEQDLESLSARELGLAVAEGMFAFARKIGFPVSLGEVEGVGQRHIDRALAAAKSPQLKMKLENMPVPLTADAIDTYMGPILEAAMEGDLSLVRNA